MLVQVLQAFTSVTKEVAEVFAGSFKDTMRIVVSPYNHIVNAKNGSDYKSQSYLSKSDNDKLYGDWVSVDEDLRKAIKNYGR